MLYTKLLFKQVGLIIYLSMKKMPYSIITFSECNYKSGRQQQCQNVSGIAHFITPIDLQAQSHQEAKKHTQVSMVGLVCHLAFCKLCFPQQISCLLGKAKPHSGREPLFAHFYCKKGSKVHPTNFKTNSGNSTMNNG